MATAVQTVPQPPIGAALADILAYQDELVRVGQYEMLGKMKRVVLEAEADARTQAPHVTGRMGHILEWYDQPHPRGGTIRQYTPIAQSLDRRMILALEPLLRRDLMGRLTERVGLPPMPDPKWKPADWTAEEIRGCRLDEAGNPIENGKDASGRPKYIPVERDPAKDTPAWIEQDLNQLTDKIVQGTELLVFQPVVQVLFQPELGGTLQATYWTLLCSFDPATRTHPALLVDRKTGTAHFYGGRYEVVPVG